ncbi:MAG TPA: alpha/beta fold hydrolase [Acidimicrobiales bacterium]|nr:alpha/beta fold hydrolase [Acidimicrobiales bacterium]
MHSYVRGGLTFDVTDEGPADGRLVIALHGFPEDRGCWSPLVPQLTGAGYRVLAPDQRGYSPGARPRRRRDYALNELAADILALADVAGADTFDVIGHDWGAGVAWELAARHPDRVRTLTALSVPHPRAMADSMLRSTQLLHSWYMLFFQLPRLPEWAMRAAGPERAVAALEKDGLDGGSARRYALRMQDPKAMTGPINWYRGLPFGPRQPLPPVSRPTLLVWGDRDRYLTRKSVERTGRYVTGPYRFEPLAGATHWLPSGATDRIAPLILDHLASHPS